MSISVGERLPEATMLRMGETGPEQVALSEFLAGRKVVIFGLPGPFTSTCTAAHLPSFMRTRAAFSEKGVDEVICYAVTDPWVMDAWSRDTGAGAAGITMLADGDGSYTRAIGMAFDAPAVGFHGRAMRHAMVVEDGVVKVLNVETARGVCEMTAGETLLEQV